MSTRPEALWAIVSPDGTVSRRRQGGTPRIHDSEDAANRALPQARRYTHKDCRVVKYIPATPTVGEVLEDLQPAPKPGPGESFEAMEWAMQRRNGTLDDE